MINRNFFRDFIHLTKGPSTNHVVLKLRFFDPTSPHVATFQIADMVFLRTFFYPPPPWVAKWVVDAP